MTWVLSQGEYGQGSEVKGLYATKAGARPAFLVLVSRLPWEPKSLESLDNASWDEDNHNPVTITAGCDYLELAWWDVSP